MLDCAILGAGPASLTALTYLARFHRRALALGAGSGPRVMRIDRSHNVPGHPDGISGKELLRRLRAQAEEMDGEVWGEPAAAVEGRDGDFLIQVAGREPLRARKVLLAMGVTDREPDLPGLTHHTGEFVRYCPICDGYEFTEKALGILGKGPEVVRHALFLRTFSERITVFLNGASPASLGPDGEQLRRWGIAVCEPRVVDILAAPAEVESEPRGQGVRLEDGSEHRLAVLYAALGCEPNLEPVRPLGIETDPEGYVVTDREQQTSVPGIYAAGDLTSQINQISVAFGQATVAAVRIHNALDLE